MVSFLGRKNFIRTQVGKTFLLPFLYHLSLENAKCMLRDSPCGTRMLSRPPVNHASLYLRPYVLPSHDDCCVDHVTSFGQWDFSTHATNRGLTGTCDLRVTLFFLLFLEPRHHVKKPRLASWRHVAQLTAKHQPPDM